MRNRSKSQISTISTPFHDFQRFWSTKVCSSEAFGCCHLHHRICLWSASWISAAFCGYQLYGSLSLKTAVFSRWKTRFGGLELVLPVDTLCDLQHLVQCSSLRCDPILDAARKIPWCCASCFCMAFTWFCSIKALYLIYWSSHEQEASSVMEHEKSFTWQQWAFPWALSQALQSKRPLLKFVSVEPSADSVNPNLQRWLPSFFRFNYRPFLFSNELQIFSEAWKWSFFSLFGKLSCCPGPQPTKTPEIRVLTGDAGFPDEALSAAARQHFEMGGAAVVFSSLCSLASKNTFKNMLPSCGCLFFVSHIAESETYRHLDGYGLRCSVMYDANCQDQHVFIETLPPLQLSLFHPKKTKHPLIFLLNIAGLHPLHWDDHLWHFDEFGILMVGYLSFGSLRSLSKC